MAKNVFRPQEIVTLTNPVHLAPPFEEEPSSVEVEPIEEYSGPTADELRREAENFKSTWEQEKAQMISEAQRQVEEILSDGKNRALEEAGMLTAEADALKASATEEAERIVSDATGEAERIIEEAEQKVVVLTTEAKEEGFKQGVDEGFKQGNGEVERLVGQLHRIINAAIAKRSDIIDEAEEGVVELVLLIARKVVKVISESHKGVVLNNCVEALRRLKRRGDVVLRVNMEDVELANSRVEEFIRLIENSGMITIMEDTSVERGGCIVETDFGQIDARISTQLKEIESRIVDLVPVRSDHPD